MDDTKRCEIEKRIAERFITDALAAGYEVAVYDGQELFGPYKHTAEVLDRMFSVDDEQLIVYSRLGPDIFRRGWVRFIYGNSGYDVIADSSANETTEGLLEGATKLADEFDDIDAIESRS